MIILYSLSVWVFLFVVACYVGIPGIGLCAEHGFYFKVPAINGDQWQCVSKRGEDFKWKDIAIGLMKQYVKRTQGSFIENKVS